MTVSRSSGLLLCRPNYYNRVSLAVGVTVVVTVMLVMLLNLHLIVRRRRILRCRTVSRLRRGLVRLGGRGHVALNH